MCIDGCLPQDDHKLEFTQLFIQQTKEALCLQARLTKKNMEYPDERL